MQVLVSISLMTASVLATSGLRRRAVGWRAQAEAALNVPACVTATITALEKCVQRDEGARGIAQLIDDEKAVLQPAAAALMRCKRVIVLTGFPCLMTHRVPQETDGPLGALAIAKALVAHGVQVCLLTDEASGCGEVLFECMAASGVLKRALRDAESGTGTGGGDDEGEVEVTSLLSIEALESGDMERLLELGSWADGVVAIERAGPNANGDHLTMTGKNMAPVVMPELCSLFDRDSRLCVGVGDGGNELGMGSAPVATSTISRAAEIACIVPSTHLLVCSVSNWGGYALAAALAVLGSSSGSSCDSGSGSSGGSGSGGLRTHWVEACIPTAAEETDKCIAITAAGARDGVRGKEDSTELSVDGMDWTVSLTVLAELRAIATAGVGATV